MIAHQYGLTYIRINESHLELIRYWRNQDFIRDTMQFKSYITPEMQKKWFTQINNPFNYYFIIRHENKMIGLINCKDAEPDTRIAEGGIFIWDKSYWGTMIPALSSLTMLQSIFDIFKSGDQSLVTVARNNQKALQFNKMLGYRINEELSNPDFYKMILTKELYETHTKKLILAANHFYKEKSEFKLEAEESQILNSDINSYIRKIKMDQNQQQN